MQVAYNYEERGMKVLVIKPLIDTKSWDSISSRIWLERKVNFLVSQNDSIKELVWWLEYDCILVDESQFLTPDQIDELWEIATQWDAPVICYGLRADFQMKWFPWSIRLLLLAHRIEELKTICECGTKAVCNMRVVDGKSTFDGEQVAIDGDDVSYDSVCARCYQNERAAHISAN